METAINIGTPDSVTLRVAETNERIVVPSQILELLLRARELSPEDLAEFDQVLAAKVSANNCGHLADEVLDAIYELRKVAATARMVGLCEFTSEDVQGPVWLITEHLERVIDKLDTASTEHCAGSVPKG